MSLVLIRLMPLLVITATNVNISDIKLRLHGILFGLTYIMPISTWKTNIS